MGEGEEHTFAVAVVAILAAGVWAVAGGVALGLWVRRGDALVVLAHLAVVTRVLALTRVSAACVAGEWAATGGAAA